MEMYKEAAMLKLRINTNVGSLSPENLFDLSVEELDALAVAAERAYKRKNGKTFLTKVSKEDKVAKLRFDIILDVLTTKVEMQDAAQNEGEIKRHNQMIDDKIAAKQDKDLDGKTVEELEALRK